MDPRRGGHLSHAWYLAKSMQRTLCEYNMRDPEDRDSCHRRFKLEFGEESHWCTLIDETSREWKFHYQMSTGNPRSLVFVYRAPSQAERQAERPADSYLGVSDFRHAVHSSVHDNIRSTNSASPWIQQLKMRLLEKFPPEYILLFQTFGPGRWHISNFQEYEEFSLMLENVDEEQRRQLMGDMALVRHNIYQLRGSSLSDRLNELDEIRRAAVTTAEDVEEGDEEAESVECNWCEQPVTSFLRPSERDGTLMHYCRMRAELWCPQPSCQRKWYSTRCIWSPARGRWLRQCCEKCWDDRATYSPGRVSLRTLEPLGGGQQPVRQDTTASRSPDTTTSSRHGRRDLATWNGRGQSPVSGARARTHMPTLPSELPQGDNIYRWDSRARRIISVPRISEATPFTQAAQDAFAGLDTVLGWSAPTEAQGEHDDEEPYGPCEEVDVLLRDLWFSQVDCSFEFQDPRCGNIDTLAEALRHANRNGIQPHQILGSAMMKVVRVEGLNNRLYSMDNRRLEAHRRALGAIPEKTIRVKLFSNREAYGGARFDAKFRDGGGTQSITVRHDRNLHDMPNQRHNIANPRQVLRNGSAHRELSRANMLASETSQADADSLATVSSAETPPAENRRAQQNDNHRRDLCEGCQRWGDCTAASVDPRCLLYAVNWHLNAPRVDGSRSSHVSFFRDGATEHTFTIGHDVRVRVHFHSGSV
eukprot:TRINITY_DN74371_c0_g1_i1.p1 TRINITY_DN74371_c0_g1~~TRINITY_DN74371_c0_g1_i1.p1  ORF type:complete len:702 (-),score=43.22 TRINITY_DN74371_c0_g1_i1:96-2201(-)